MKLGLLVGGTLSFLLSALTTLLLRVLLGHHADWWTWLVMLVPCYVAMGLLAAILVTRRSDMRRIKDDE